MNTAIWTVARRLAFSADRRQRWRQISVVLGAALATCATLLAASVIHLGAMVTDHTEARQPTVADTAAETKLLVDITGPILPETSQFPIVWLDPLPGSEDAPAAVPPGLSALPEPGAAVLSPGLAAHGYTAEDFGFSASSAGTGQGGTIGDAGLASRSEGFMYVRVAEGRSIAEQGTTSSGFGLPGDSALVETTLDVPSTAGAILGATWLLFLPAMAVMVGAARAVSQVRTQRAETLWRLGISRKMIACVVGAETLALAAIGASVGATTWAIGIAPATTVPGVDAELVPGALSLPWPVAVAAVALTLATATLASLWLKREPRRPTVRATVLRAGPLAACLAAMTIAGWAPRLFAEDAASMGIKLLMVAGAATVLTLPLAIAPLLAVIGLVGKSARRPAMWLAGNLVVTRRTTLARPAAMAATLVYLVGVSTAMIQGLPTSTPSSVVPTDDRSVWSVAWADVREGDREAAAERAETAGALVLPVAPVPFEESTAADVGPPAQGLISLPDCAAAQEFFGMGPETVRCADGGATIAALPYEVTFAPVAGGDEVLLSAPPSWTESDALAVFAGLPVVNAWKLAGTDEFSFPTYDWYAVAMVAATALLAAGLMRELGDRVVMVVGERSRLLRAGLRPDEADWVYGLATMLPVVVALPLGYLAARIFAANGVGYAVTSASDSVDVIAIVAVFVAVIAVVVVASTLWWQQRVDSTPRPDHR